MKTSRHGNLTWIIENLLELDISLMQIITASRG